MEANLTVKEALTTLQCCRATLYKKIDSGSLNRYKRGGRLYFKQKEVMRLKKQMERLVKVQSTQAPALVEA